MADGMDRRAAVATLLKDRGDLLVISGLGSPSYDLFATGDHDANFYLWGAMGGAAMMGLGLALAQPERPVAVITGDGEQLMALGALATIAVAAPSNFTLLVLDNGEYGETGGQRSHTAHRVDLCAMATAAGFAACRLAANLDGVAALRPAIRETVGGPRFVHLVIAAGATPKTLPPRDGAFLKTRFRAHLGIPPT